MELWHRLSGAVNGVFHPWEPAARGQLPRHGLPLCSSKGKSTEGDGAGAHSSLQRCPGCSSLQPSCLGCLSEPLVPLSAQSRCLISLRAHFWAPSHQILSSPPGNDSASGAGSPPAAATCGLRGAPRCHPGLRGSVCIEAELSAEISGLAASGEAGATRSAELHVLRHLLPKPLRAPASLTALAPVQSLFKSPVQPPRAQILSPVDKLIDSSSDLIIFAHTFLFLGVCREGVSCYSFLFTL